MKALSLIAFGASALVANRVGQRSAAPPTTTTAATAAGAAAPHDCSGGPEELVAVDLAPAAVVRAAGGERMTIAIDVHHHLEEPAAIVGAVELIDDRGRRLGAATDLAVRALPARGRTAYQIETPDKLADGYYRMQVSVLARAGRAGGVEDFSTHQLYLHAAGGELAAITSHDWLTQSESGLAFTSP